MAFENLFRPPKRRRFLIAVSAAAASVLVYLSVEQFKVVPGTAALGEESTAPRVLGDRSIAVVPLAGEASGALSHAVALEFIRLLSRVPEIEVIAARSALAARKVDAVPGEQPVPFEVAWILEIQSLREGDELRLGSSLIAAGEETPVWGLERVLPPASMAGFMGDVIAALAEHLGFQSPPQTSWPQGLTASAYQDYATAWLMQTGGDGLATARRLLEGVLELSPEWAPALAAHAHNLMLQAAAGGEDADSLVQTARGELNKAEALQPDLAEIHLYRSLIAHRFDRNWLAAYAAAQEALARAPGDAAVLAAASTAAFTLGKFEEGVDQLRRAIALDPRVLSHRLKYALMLEFSGKHQAAIDAYRELMVIDPDYPGVHAYLARTLVIVGRAEAALRHLAFEPSPFWRSYGRALALHGLGRDAEAGAQLEALIGDYGSEAAVQIAEIHAYAGRSDMAFEWLTTAVEQHDPGLASLLGNPLFEALENDRRWRELLESLGLPKD